MPDTLEDLTIAVSTPHSQYRFSPYIPAITFIHCLPSDESPAVSDLSPLRDRGFVSTICLPRSVAYCHIQAVGDHSRNTVYPIPPESHHPHPFLPVNSHLHLMLLDFILLYHSWSPYLTPTTLLLYTLLVIFPVSILSICSSAHSP